MKQFLLLLWLFPFIVAGQTWEEAAESADTWLANEMEFPATMKPVTVEFPLVVRSTGRGCRCPEYYIGVGTTVKEGPFLRIKNVPKDFPVSDSTGHSLVVTGHFTGEYNTLDLRKSSGEPKEWIYQLPVFVIDHWKENKPGYDVPAPHSVN